MKQQDSQPVNLDLDRQRRCGFPEVVFGEGKTVETLTVIFLKLQGEGTSVLATRVAEEKAEQLLARFSNGRYNRYARTFRIPSSQPTPRTGRVVVITAGTSD